MKLLALFFASMFLLSACSTQKVESQNRSEENGVTTQNEMAKTPVLVELFTSEG